jgi:hypothetical protein
MTTIGLSSTAAAMAARSRTIFISWERHRRTRELCRTFGVELVELTSGAPRIVRYPVLLARTAVRLAQARPDVVFIQCPSVLLGVWAGLLKYVFGYALVADLHNEAVEPFNYSFRAYRWLLGWIARRADLSLVTNGPLKTVIDQRGGSAFVLPDKVPSLEAADPGDEAVDVTATAHVVFVCSYAPDEPYLEVFEAARLLGPGVIVHVTGNPPAFSPDINLPANLRLTGYLPGRQYEDLLRSAGAIVDLTRMENCLVCGAYEAVAVERPLVTSDTRALRAYFSRGTVYAAHTAESLAGAITEALREQTRLAAEMRILKMELREEWERQGEALLRRLDLV